MLTVEIIDKKTRQFIDELYGCDYKRELRIKPLPTIGWEVGIPLGNDEKPFVVAIEAEGDTFLKYLRKSLLLIRCLTRRPWPSFSHRTRCRHEA